MATVGGAIMNVATKMGGIGLKPKGLMASKPVKFGKTVRRQ
jgi:hypothetical protein